MSETKTLEKVSPKENAEAMDQLKELTKGGEGSELGVAGKRLLSFFERIERLEEEKAALAEGIKDVFAESKAVGFDVKTMRHILKLRKKDIEKRREEQEMLDLYMSAIGME